MIKKIRGTRSYIWVEFNDKIIGIEGELTLTPAFYADKKTVKNLTDAEDVLTNEDKDQIVNEVLHYNKDQPVKIFFE